MECDAKKHCRTTRFIGPERGSESVCVCVCASVFLCLSPYPAALARYLYLPLSIYVCMHVLLYVCMRVRMLACLCLSVYLSACLPMYLRTFLSSLRRRLTRSRNTLTSVPHSPDCTANNPDLSESPTISEKLHCNVSMTAWHHNRATM